MLHTVPATALMVRHVPTNGLISCVWCRMDTMKTWRLSTDPAVIFMPACCSQELDLRNFGH